MFRRFMLPAVLAAGFGLTGCDVFDDDDDDPVIATPPAETAALQVLHASPDAPAVNVLVDGAETLSGVDFKQGSAELELDVGDYEIQVDAIVPGGVSTVIGPVTVTLAADTLYTVAAIGEVAVIDAAVLQQDDTDVAAGSVRLRVLHAAPGAPEVDVYVTAPNADLTAAAPTATFSFGEDAGPVEVATGDYQIRITAAGDPAAVVFDSGTVTLPDAADLTVAAVDNRATGMAPVSLSVLDGTGTFEIFDIGTPAALRIVHGSPDAPNVDIFVNDDFAAPLVTNLAYSDVFGFADVAPGDYNLKVTPAGDPGVIVIDADATLAVSQYYDVIAANLLASIEPLLLNDDPRALATAAKLRLIHGSPAAGNVDVFVTAPGADLTQETPTLTDVAFAANTGFLEIAPGDYEVTITATGTTTPAIGPLAVTLDAAGVYTAIAADADGGGTPLGVILLDDFL